MELISRSSQVMICGDSYLEIENCRRILEYNDVYLKVKTYNGLMIEIWGSGLMLSDYNTLGIAVRGKISSVEFSGKERE